MVAFTLPGNLPVYAYALMLGLGASLGLAGVAWLSPAWEVKRRVDAGWWVLLGTLLGGRIIFILIDWQYFQTHLSEIFALRQGGLSWPGALVGGLLALVAFAQIYAAPLGEHADALLPLFASLAVFSWLGCWLDGCAYGAPTSAWWGLAARDEWGQITARWPVQLVGAAITAGIVILIDILRPRLAAGLAGAYTFVGLCLVMLALSFLRSDPALLWRGLRLESWAALGLTAIALPWGIGLTLNNTLGLTWRIKRSMKSDREK